MTLERTLAVYDRGLAAGHHVGMQLAVSLDGELVADTALGLAAEGVPMRSDSLTIWLSTTKTLTAVAIAQLWEDGWLRLDAPVAEYLPEFGAHGKDAVTVRHVLTHTGGFPDADATDDGQMSVDELYRRICAAPLEDGWRPGLDAGYHRTAGHVVLGELVTRLSGQPFSTYVRSRILEPVGATDFWIGIPPQDQTRYGDRLASMWQCHGPVSGPVGALDTEAARERPHPGMAGRGPANQLLRVLDALRTDARGDRPPLLLRAQTWEAFTARHRTGLHDRTFNAVRDWGLGVIPGSPATQGIPVPYGYGAHCSRRTWGHSGSESSTGFVDPEHGLTVTLVFNGMPGHARHTRRQHDVLTALYEDLELA